VCNGSHSISTLLFRSGFTLILRWLDIRRLLRDLPREMGEKKNQARTYSAHLTRASSSRWDSKHSGDRQETPHALLRGSASNGRFADHPQNAVVWRRTFVNNLDLLQLPECKVIDCMGYGFLYGSDLIQRYSFQALPVVKWISSLLGRQSASSLVGPQ